jgi:plasmid stability protein
MSEVVSVRGLRDGFLADVDVRAGAEGLSREAWLREKLEALVQGPVVRRRYKLRAYGEGDTYCQVNREWDIVTEGAKNCSQEQFAAFKRAAELVRRNEPGDRERAISLLQAVFDEVFEA